MLYDKIAAAIVLTQERIKNEAKHEGTNDAYHKAREQLRGVRRATAHLADALIGEPGFDCTRFVQACGYTAQDDTLPSMQAATRTGDHQTSKDAAKAVTRVKGKIALAVLSYARQNPQGFIDDDLKVAFSNSPESSYRKRRSELVKAGFLAARPNLAHRGQIMETRKNRHGRDETVWFLTEKGRTVV